MYRYNCTECDISINIVSHECKMCNEPLCENCDKTNITYCTECATYYQVIYYQIFKCMRCNTSYYNDESVKQCLKCYKQCCNNCFTQDHNTCDFCIETIQGDIIINMNYLSLN